MYTYVYYIFIVVVYYCHQTFLHFDLQQWQKKIHFQVHYKILDIKLKEKQYEKIEAQTKKDKEKIS